MTCRDCELLLSEDEIPANAQGHLNGCAACRGLADEIAANAAVLREFRDEAVPFRAAPILPPARPSWKWAALVPAFLVLVAVFLRWNTPDRAVATHTPHAVTQKPLMVKMLTSDPNVVIYWQIEDTKEQQ